MNSQPLASQEAASIAQSSRKFTETLMKLRFRVNQAECFRRGINCDKSIVVLEVDPGTLDIKDRSLIADRLDGIDVVELIHTYEDNRNLIQKHYAFDGMRQEYGRAIEITKAVLIEANEPTLEALLDACRLNHQKIVFEMTKPRQ